MADAMIEASEGVFCSTPFPFQWELSLPRDWYQSAKSRGPRQSPGSTTSRSVLLGPPHEERRNATDALHLIDLFRLELQVETFLDRQRFPVIS
jgi:hypothetical protein